MQDNSTHNAPIFQSIFQENWDNLPTVMRKHYTNRPYCDDIVTVEGTMDITFNSLTACLSPLFKLCGILVPYQGKSIPTTVHYKSHPHSNAFCLDRIFHFPGRPAYHFHSYMLPKHKNEIVEYMALGLGWHAAYLFDGSKVMLKHKGYVWKIWKLTLPIPLEWLIGKGHAEEIALSDNMFAMQMDITHLLWGKIFQYNGEFKVIE